MSIAILVTQATSLTNGHPTGAWAEEIAAPYYIIKDAGYKVLIVSPNGGKVTFDKNSLTDEAITPITRKWLDDEAAQKELNSSVKLSDVNLDDLIGIFAAGGHGAAVDFPEDKVIASVVGKLYDSGKLVSSVCHGAEIFATATDKNGDPIVKGKKITGFSDSEEKAVGLDTVPGLHAPETIVKKLGANYSKAPKDWESFVEIDTSGSGPLVTGQNPGSSEAVAEAVVKVLKGN